MTIYMVLQINRESECVNVFTKHFKDREKANEYFETQVEDLIEKGWSMEAGSKELLDVTLEWFQTGETETITLNEVEVL